MKIPIVIFLYNRPKHTKNLIETLKKNNLSKNQKIFIFCDGPKNSEDILKINKIKSILKNSNLNICKVFFKKRNVGLSKNIIYGVTYILNKFEKCIVIEDDLILNPAAINFMNKMLNFFKDDQKIGSISAYSYIHNYKGYKGKKFYITKRHCSWCWGTWSRVWKNIKWNKINYKNHFESEIEMNKFSYGGNDLNLLLWGQYKNLIDSWAIRFNYFCSKNNLYSIQPRFSMILNNGQDMSGTHEKYKLKKKINIDFNPKINNKSKTLSQITKSKKIDNFIKFSHKKSLRLSLKYFFQNRKFI